MNIVPEETFSPKTKSASVSIREKDETGVQECLEIIVFRLAYETYGIETAFVREVYPLKDITTLPGTRHLFWGLLTFADKLSRSLI